MSDDPVTMTEIEETRLDWTAQHRQDYLRSGGTKGHVGIEIRPDRNSELAIIAVDSAWAEAPLNSRDVIQANLPHFC